MLRKMNCRALCLATLGCISASAHSEFQYAFIEGTYIIGELEFSDSELDIDGYELTGQFNVSPNYVVGISYTSLEGDDTITTATGQQSFSYKAEVPELYAFFHQPLAVQADYLFGARIEFSDIEATVPDDSSITSEDESIKHLFAGLRYRVYGLELNGEASYNLDAEGDEDEWSYTVGLLSGEPTGLQLGVEYTPDDDVDLMGVSIRQSF